MGYCDSQILTNIGLGCKDNMGGIKVVYIAEYDVAQPVYYLADSDDDITTAVYDADKTASTWKKFEFRKGTSSMTSTVNVDDAAGTTFVQTDVALQFSKLDTTKRLAISALMFQNVAVIVKDQNDMYWGLGIDNPVTLTAGTANTGTAYGDVNGYNITLTDMSKYLPLTISEDLKEVIDAL